MTVVLTVIDDGSSSDLNNSHIFQAIESDNLEQIKLLIESGSDVNLTQQDGISPLECAVIQSSINMVKFLLSAGAKPDQGFQSPLKQAISKEQPDIVQALIDAGANVNLLLEDQETPLIHAVAKGSLEIVKILVEAGADVKVISKHEDHALLLAAASGHQDIFDYLSPFVSLKQRRQAQRALESGIREKQRKQNRLVEKLVDAAGLGNLQQVQEAIAGGVDVNAIGSGGSTALYQASWWGRTKVLKELIASGADIEIQHEEDQFTPLLGAVRMAASSSVFLLLKAGANPNAITKDEIYTPLIMGADTYIVGKDIFKMLLESGAELNARNHYGNTALMAATYTNSRSSIFNRVEAIEIFQEAGASTEGLDGIELIVASRKGNLERVKSLIDSGVNVNARAYYGETALLEASSAGHVEIVRELTKIGADANAVSEWSPLMRAVMYNHTDIVRLLLLAGANIAQKTTCGKSVSQIRTRHPEILALLKQARAEQKIRNKNKV